MKATITWNGGTAFTGLSTSGIPVQMESGTYEEGHVIAPRPMEMILMGLAGCLAMDVLSILEKKRQNVTSFLVNVDAPRSPEYPKVFASAIFNFAISGRRVEEAAVLRAIELSATKYCAAYAMLSKAFSITLEYEIFEEGANGSRQATYQGTWQEPMQE